MYEVKNSAEGRVFRCRSIRLTQVASTGTMNTYPSHASMLVSGLPKHAIIRYYSPHTAESPRLCSRLSTQWSLTATMQVLVLPKCDYTGIRYLPRISAQAAYVGKGQTVSGRRSGERLPTKCIRLYIRSEEAPMTSRCRRHSQALLSDDTLRAQNARRMEARVKHLARICGAHTGWHARGKFHDSA